MALTPVLSVLIATTRSRSRLIRPLLKSLVKQTKGLDGIVEIIINRHEKDNIGKKRNILLNQAKGKYVVAIDSDDVIAKNYISVILEACKSDSDCIGISGKIITDKGTSQWHISMDYGSWSTENGVYLRTPNHISPVKREIALQAMFPEITSGEDAEYSRRIFPLLKTETKIEQDIYFYYPSANKKDYR